MKHIIATLMLAAAAVPVIAESPAADELQLRLGQINSEYGDRYFYNWNEKNKIDEIWLYEDIVNEGLEATLRRYYYDTKGLVIQEQTYEDLGKTLDLDRFKYVSRVDYDYDDDGHMTERVVYNQFSDWEFGSTSQYTYNEDGQRTSMVIYLNQKMTDKLMDVEYTYDTEGRLIKEFETIYNMAESETDKSYAVTRYTYDVEGLLMRRTEFLVDPYDMAEAPRLIYVFTYDAEDNLQSVSRTDAAGETTARYEYTYTLTPMADVLFPVFPERDDVDLVGAYSQMRLAPAKMVDYEMDQNSNTLQLYDTYNYKYTRKLFNGNPLPGAVKNNFANAAFERVAVAALTADRLMLKGVTTMEDVRLFTIDGRFLGRRAYTVDGVDIADLPAGAYIALTRRGSAPFTK